MQAYLNQYRTINIKLYNWIKSHSFRTKINRAIVAHSTITRRRDIFLIINKSTLKRIKTTIWRARCRSRWQICPELLEWVSISLSLSHWLSLSFCLICFDSFSGEFDSVYVCNSSRLKNISIYVATLSFNTARIQTQWKQNIVANGILLFYLLYVFVCAMHTSQHLL